MEKNYLRNRVKKQNIEKPLIDTIFKVYGNHKSYGLKDREGQHNMSLDISEAYINDENAMIEAGVGIGKSFGYLIPSLYINHFMNQPIIIATSSIQLSEQIHQDLFTISKKLGFSGIRSIIGKGMGQYACRQRASEIYEIKDKKRSGFEAITPIVEGIMDMDINERSDISGGITDSEWSKLCVNKCNFERCFYKNTCTFYNMRSKINARNGDIDFIIVNQDLLIRDLIKKRDGLKGLITEHPALIIIDEAHNLESKVRDARTVEFTLRQTERDLDNALQLLVRKTGERSFFTSLKILKRVIMDVFKQIEADLLYTANQDTDRMKIGKLTGIPFRKVAQIFKDINLRLSILETDRQERDIDNSITAIVDLNYLFDILSGEEEGYLIWATKPKKEATISICPKRISQILNYNLFEGSTPVILTSATMCQGGKTLEEEYAYISKSLGYSGEYKDRQISPFDYNNHSILYISNQVPYYKHENKDAFLEAACRQLIRLCDLTQGRTLVLFSAKEDMRVIQEKLSTEELRWTLHIQKEGSSQDEVIQQFRESKGVLLGTGVFWEGVNIEGSDLTQVIIVRLPFPVPADPVYEYKASISKDPHNEIFLPDMLLRLRQGTGRLIRSESDLGILSILDSRLSAGAARNYRKTVLDALPFKNVTEDFEEVERFVIENLKI